MTGLVALAGCKTTKTFVGSDDVSTPTTIIPVGGTAPIGARIDSVAIVGDSITEASAEELREAFGHAGIDDVFIDGQASRRIEVGSGDDGISGIRAIEDLLELEIEPEAWVIGLGTNDVGGLGSPEDCANLINEILDLIPGDVPLVWVNVYRPGEPEQTDLFNSVLAQQLDERGDATVADWFSVASNEELDVLRGDNLHPNDEGQIVFADLVVQALQRL
jgi:lysophospholipase L1-like esterase